MLMFTSTQTYFGPDPRIIMVGFVVPCDYMATEGRGKAAKQVERVEYQLLGAIGGASTSRRAEGLRGP
jgi:hypothetical protein